MTKPSLKLFRPSGSPIIGAFLTLRRYPIPSGIPLAGALNTGVEKIWRFSTEIVVYLGNGAR